MSAVTNSNAPCTAIPTSRNGNKISQTNGYSTTASNASGQQRRNKTQNSKNLNIVRNTQFSPSRFPGRLILRKETS
jgi:hypothetical protein